MAQVPLPPPPLPVGQDVRQVSADRQIVSKVPLVEKRDVVVALVPVAKVKKRLVNVPVVEKRFVEVACVVVDLVIELNIFAPVNALLSVRRVEEAALIVMSCEPLKATPFIFLEV